MKKKIFIVMAVLIILFILYLSLRDLPNNPVSTPSKIYGEKTTQILLPCSAGGNCPEGPALLVNGEKLLLVKEVFFKSENSKMRNFTDCQNDVCVTICQDEECYYEDDTGTYVYGKIVTGSDFNHILLNRKHILLEQSS
jgi:hypothetical protein